MIIKQREEIDLIAQGAEILSQTLGQLASLVKPGVCTKYLDSVAEIFIRDNGASPSFKGYEGFPYSICTSVNSEVVHGVPSELVLQDGDIVSLDCGVYYKGFHSDAAFTCPVGEIDASVMRLLKVAKKSLYVGLDTAKVGNRLGNLGHAIQNYVQQQGYSIVRALVGHGIGKDLHESPNVPNYGRRGTGAHFKKGLVIAVEPMVNLGKKEVISDKKGVYKTLDGSQSAHFEHTVVILEDKAKILTTHKYAESFFDF